MPRFRFVYLYLGLAVGGALLPLHAQNLRVATYNLDGYLEQTTSRRQAKSEASRAKIREVIQSAKPDVLALQEVGSPGALAELTRSLKDEGLDYPFIEFVSGADTNFHISVLSRFPFTLQYPHTNDTFLLGGRRLHVSRGFGEVEVQVKDGYRFTLITAHLKSRRSVPQEDESEIRFAEAKLLRQKVDARLAAEPNVNLIVLGDFNDTKDSLPVRTIVGGGTSKLTDTRPAELAPSAQRNLHPETDSRPVTWTHYYAQNDTYSRIDYILLSPGMAKEWIPEQSGIPRLLDWGLASDHRLVLAAFMTEDR